MLLHWFYELNLDTLYPLVIAAIAGAAELGSWLGRRNRQGDGPGDDIGTLTGAALGLLALLLAFSFSIGLARYDARRDFVVQEANAIGTTVNFGMMLPQPQREQVAALLRDYTKVRIGLGVPYDLAKEDRDVARSLELQAQLWQIANAITAADPQSLPAYRFVATLNEMTNIHESRLNALRYHVPDEVMALLILVAMVALGFTGYHSALTGARHRLPTLIMALTVGFLIMLVIDLDRPSRGLILVPTQALADALAGIPAPNK